MAEPRKTPLVTVIRRKVKNIPSDFSRKNMFLGERNLVKFSTRGECCSSDSRSFCILTVLKQRLKTPYVTGWHLKDLPLLLEVNTLRDLASVHLSKLILYHSPQAHVAVFKD